MQYGHTTKRNTPAILPTEATEDLAMPRKPVKTFHYAAVAKSLERQNEAIVELLMMVKAVVKYHAGLSDYARTELQRAVEECEAAMWPEGE